MTRSIHAWLLGAFALSGCTLAVDGLEPPTCETNSQCAVLNELEGIASDACELYQCTPQARCELSARDDDRDGRVAPQCASAPLAQGRPVDCNDAVPSGTEVCNGLDDDCDGVIDERFEVDGVVTNPMPPALPGVQLAGDFAASGLVGYGTSPSGLAVVHTERPAARFGLVSGTSSTSAVVMEHRRARSLTGATVLSDPTLDPGCHVPTTTGYADTNCDFHEVALGLTPENVFAAAISRTGCNTGQMRVGYFPRSGPAHVIQRGPARRSNAFAGVDVSTTGMLIGCTGASRTSGNLGVTRPNVMALNQSGAEDQALAAWLADGVMRPACGGSTVDVEILGLHVQQDTAGVPYGWVTASNEGLPQVIGQTAQGGMPGIAALEGTGYLVGFGAPGSGVRLVFVETMARPPAYDRDGAPESRAGLETPALNVVDLGTVPTSGAADDVALAFGTVRSGGIDVGVTWREGCGSGAERIHFRQLFLARSGGTVSVDEARSFERIELTADATAAGPPTIVATLQGMLARGVQRADGRPTGTSDNDGGYIVAWADASNRDPGPNEDTRILARRISEADGRLLNDAEILVLNAPGDVRRLRPVLYTDEQDRVLYSFLAAGEGFQGGALTCTAP